MSLWTDAALPILAVGLLIVAINRGVFDRAADRPLVTLAVGLVLAEIIRRLGVPMVDVDMLGQLARLALAALVFLAAQQCRLSRAMFVSKAAFRLSLWAMPLFVLLFTISASIIMPGLSLWGTLLIAMALMLGGAPVDDGPLLSAPVNPETKTAARLESAFALVVGVPAALIVEAATAPMPAGQLLVDTKIFLCVAGFPLGAAIGLLAGRWLPAPKAALPVMPFLVAGTAIGTALFLGFDPVFAALGAGVLYSEESATPGTARTRLWRAGERTITPLAFLALGFVLTPFALQANFLILVMAAVAVTGVRVVPRLAVLPGDIPPSDRTFLAWYGGAPGTASALLLVIFASSPSAILQDQAPLTVATLTLILGVILSRVATGPLTIRLARASARDRQRRFSPA